MELCRQIQNIPRPRYRNRRNRKKLARPRIDDSPQLQLQRPEELRAPCKVVFTTEHPGNVAPAESAYPDYVRWRQPEQPDQGSKPDDVAWFIDPKPIKSGITPSRRLCGARRGIYAPHLVKIMSYFRQNVEIERTGQG